VSDTGCGMDDRTRAHLFEPFFTTKDVGKGTGLGLSMVYGLIKQSGGHIEVQSTMGRGTTFTIYLPEAEDRTTTAPLSVPSSEEARGTETILLVEDEEGVRSLSREILRRKGYKVLEA